MGTDLELFRVSGILLAADNLTERYPPGLFRTRRPGRLGRYGMHVLFVQYETILMV